MFYQLSFLTKPKGNHSKFTTIFSILYYGLFPRLFCLTLDGTTKTTPVDGEAPAASLPNNHPVAMEHENHTGSSEGKSVLQGKLTKLAIQIGYAGRSLNNGHFQG